MTGSPPSGYLRRAAFLDRDGVINRSAVVNGKPFAPRRVEDFRLLPGAVQAIRDLKSMGLWVIVVTNQPDIGNGLVDRSVVEAMHRRLRERSPIDDIRVCPHRQDAGCRCRKPEPGMLMTAAEEWGIDLRNSFMVGDRPGDIVAGQRAGCYTIFVNRHYKEPLQIEPDSRVASLPAAVRMIGVLLGTKS